MPRSRTERERVIEACHALPESNLVNRAMQIEGGWGRGGHLTSGMLHLHDQLKTCVQNWACAP